MKIRELYLGTSVSISAKRKANISAKWKTYHVGSDSFRPKLTSAIFYQRDQMVTKIVL